MNIHISVLKHKYPVRTILRYFSFFILYLSFFSVWGTHFPCISLQFNFMRKYRAQNLMAEGKLLFNVQPTWNVSVSKEFKLWKNPNGFSVTWFEWQYTCSVKASKLFPKSSTRGTPSCLGSEATRTTNMPPEPSGNTQWKLQNQSLIMTL